VNRIKQFCFILTSQNLECSEQFRLLNFKQSSYSNSQNKEMPMFELTRDGFSFLVMNFTGAKVQGSYQTLSICRDVATNFKCPDVGTICAFPTMPKPAQSPKKLHKV
jgi:hypothetical protein